MSVAAAHVLVAEDDAGIRGNLARLLRLEGFRVSTAADGQAAQALLRQERPDLLLSDVMMPGADGLALLAWVRAEPRLAGLPVLLLTARVEESDMQAGLAAGADAYLVKPCPRDALLRQIRALLGRPAQPT